MCQAINDACNPRNCPVEFCKWRDVTWIKEQMERWAYTTSEPPKK